MNNNDHPSSQVHARLAALADLFGRKQYEILGEALDLWTDKARAAMRVAGLEPATEAPKRNPQPLKEPEPQPEQVQQTIAPINGTPAVTPARRGGRWAVRDTPCKFCGRLWDTRGLRAHEAFCRENPNRSTRKDFEPGKPPLLGRSYDYNGEVVVQHRKDLLHFNSVDEAIKGIQARGVGRAHALHLVRNAVKTLQK